MAKRLVICCDGTWDKPIESDHGVRTSTNAHKVYAGLAAADAGGDPQVPFYQLGVGTGGRLDRVGGGLLGVGLARNVRACYEFIVENYEPGDALYFFGFSRGAFTARSTVGMVRNSGILRREHRDRLDDAFRLYRDRSEGTKPGSDPAKAFRERYSHPDGEIHFVGVWDTVGALGVPFPIPFWRRLWGFHDTQLSARVANAFHAIAIDERRRPFSPTLWTRTDEPPGQRLEQVWFAGVHRDVGGGHADPGLADIALRWMVERAGTCGLSFDTDHFDVVEGPIEPQDAYAGVKIAPDALGTMHVSFKGFFKLFGSRWRTIPFAGRRASTSKSRQSVARTAERRAALDPGYTSPRLRTYLEREPEITEVTHLPIP